MFNAWLQAKAANDPQLQAAFARRFTPEYGSAFQAWLKTDPFINPAAPAGPGYMPQYHNRQLEEARRLNDRASAAFTEGTEARETADTYVRVTVLFALGAVPGGGRPTLPGPDRSDRGERGRLRPAGLRPLFPLHPAPVLAAATERRCSGLRT